MAKPSKPSGSAEVQRLKVLDCLRRRPHSTEDLRREGIYQAPTRIFELRGRGHKIETTPITVIDRDGFAHAGVALYSLTEPMTKEA